MDFHNKKILVIGDIMLDTYVSGSVSRISPEAPIPILNKTYSYSRLGGAANVACNLKSLGAMVWIIGRIGADSAGDTILKSLSDKNIYFDFLMRDENLPTTVKTRYISGNQQLLRVDSEVLTSVEDTPFADDLISDIDRHLRNFDAIIISDYNKGVVFPRLLTEIGNLKSEYSKIVTVDTKKTDISLFKNFTTLKANKSELCNLSKRNLRTLYDIKTASSEITFDNNIEHLLTTLSEEGLFIFDSSRIEDESCLYIPANTTEIVDVSGAGDTVIAVYTLILSLGHSPFIAAQFANKAAGIVVTKKGTATITLEELLK